jgi:hypothetical protein
MLNGIMLNVVMLNVVMLNVVMLNGLESKLALLSFDLSGLEYVRSVFTLKHSSLLCLLVNYRQVSFVALAPVFSLRDKTVTGL